MMKQIRPELGCVDEAATSTAVQTPVLTTDKDTTRTPSAETYLPRLVETIRNALLQMGIQLEEEQGDKAENKHNRLIERMAVLIHDSMSAETRRYHSVQHVFDVASGVSDDPLAVLAALFHDSVYFHVDGGLSDLQRQHLNIFEDAFAQGDKLPEYRVKGNASDDTLLRMVENIFGFPLNAVVTHRNGLNEFLSAVVCVRLLEPLLPLQKLAEIACCIEATIPFRPNTTDAQGNVLTPPDRLYQQLDMTNTKFELGLTSDEMVQAVQRAVRVANEDVANFGTADVLWFLDNTWDLLPETNEALRKQSLYTVQDFQFAVFKMYTFFNYLKPGLVFQEYKGVPSAQVLHERQKYTSINLTLGSKYVGAKFLALSVLAAFAELTGGDAPVSLFMGDLPSPDRRTKCPLFPTGDLSQPSCIVERDPTVFKILREGRRSETSFDIRQSPMAAYLYGHLGDELVSKLLRKPNDKWETLYPITEATARALLQELPRECVQKLGASLATMASSRKQALESLIQKITEDEKGAKG